MLWLVEFDIEADGDVLPLLFAIDDEFVKQASVSSQMKTYHMDTQSVIEEVKNAKEQ